MPCLEQVWVQQPLIDKLNFCKKRQACLWVKVKYFIVLCCYLPLLGADYKILTTNEDMKGWEEEVVSSAHRRSLCDDKWCSDDPWYLSRSEQQERKTVKWRPQISRWWKRQWNVSSLMQNTGKWWPDSDTCPYQATDSEIQNTKLAKWKCGKPCTSSS